MLPLVRITVLAAPSPRNDLANPFRYGDTLVCSRISSSPVWSTASKAPFTSMKAGATLFSLCHWAGVSVKTKVKASCCGSAGVSPQTLENSLCLFCVTVMAPVCWWSDSRVPISMGFVWGVEWCWHMVFM